MIVTHTPMPPDPMPSLREFEVLHAVLRHGTTAAAARALGITQPAISRAIASLEGRLGRQMFLRAGGVLTPATDALALSEGAQALIGALTRLVHSQAAPVDSVAISLITTTTLANALLAPLLPGLIAGWPDLRLQVEIASSAAVLTAVADGGADAGLLDQFTGHGSLVAEVLHRGEAAVALPPGHALAASRVVSLAALAGERLVALPRRFPLRAALDRAFRDAGLAPRIVLEAATAQFAAALVLRGVGVAVLNPFPLAGAEPGLVFRPLGLPLTLETAVVLPGGVAPRPPVARFVGLLRDAMAGMRQKLPDTPDDPKERPA
jgi:DNA-binding transcriptional LysR family regulator